MRRAGAAAIILLMVGAATSGARAQQPATGLPPPAPGAWQVNLAPYFWLPTANMSLKYNLPPGFSGRLPTDVSSGPGDYISHLDFGAMASADARYGPFSLLTDFMYVDFSVTGSATTIRSVDFAGAPSIPLSAEQQRSAGTTLKATVWTLAGAYTVAQGRWGNLDLLAGVRVLGINVRTNYSLDLALTGPRGNGPRFGGIGYVSGVTDVWNGIAGLRGRAVLGESGLFVPYYFDIGAGGSQLTWQISSGLGYASGRWAFSLIYRYLSFEQNGDTPVKHIGLHGPLLMVNITL